MQLEIKELEDLAEKLNISKDEMISKLPQEYQKEVLVHFTNKGFLE